MTEELIVRPLRVEDVFQLQSWGKHTDPLFYAYNFPYTRPREFILWHQSKYFPLRRYIFGAFLGEKLVGYITLKQIRWFRGEAFMGVAFDPNMLSRGLGTEAIRQYVALVFKRFKHLHTIKLKTAVFNERAQKAYLKVGFEFYQRVHEPFEDQSQSFNLLLNFPFFQMRSDELWTEYYYMKIERSKTQE